jgi:hypothetical protein
MTQLTVSEQLLLYTLTHLVRYVSKRQVARLLGFPSVADAERVLGSLKSKRLVRYGLVRACPPAECPVRVHHHGDFEDPLDDADKSLFFSQLHNKIKKHVAKTRSAGARLPQFPVAHATEFSVGLFGGAAPNLSKPYQQEHDLRVSEIVVADTEILEQSLLVGELAILAHTAAALVRFNGKGTLPRFAQIPQECDEAGNSPTAASSPLVRDEPAKPFGALARSLAKSYDLPETFQLSNTFDRRWFGEDYLVRHKLSVSGYVPDLAVVVGGRIVHAVDVVTKDYGKKRLVEINDRCVANAVSYELYC